MNVGNSRLLNGELRIADLILTGSASFPSLTEMVFKDVHTASVLFMLHKVLFEISF